MASYHDGRAERGSERKRRRAAQRQRGVAGGARHQRWRKCRRGDVAAAARRISNGNIDDIVSAATA